ncbi:MAG: TIGR03032 family protein [Cyanobacteria bacterium J06600_6]
MSQPTEAQAASSEREPMRSVHTNNFPEILRQLGISLVVSTYQAGKLIVLRSDGEHINTHFRMFQKPMGIATDRHKIALGCSSQIWELINIPAVAGKVEPAGKHDACYLPRQSHITGDIDIHEMEWGGKDNSDLWFVNTRFSCLCTLDKNYSFVPRWRPNFVTALTPEDRCHLNGMAMVNQKPQYVTALGETNELGGWRANKANGGILIDVPSQEIIARGISMPHSPRCYNDRLWILESGEGSLSLCDRTTGRLESVITLPGFTRGIDFYGSFAFIGLSQVRETAVFSGLPLTERLDERICGVWVVNLETARTVAFLKFEDAVQEIFAVRVLPNMRFPEIIDYDEKLMANSYVLPDEALADVPQDRLSIS